MTAGCLSPGASRETQKNSPPAWWIVALCRALSLAAARVLQARHLLLQAQLPVLLRQRPLVFQLAVAALGVAGVGVFMLKKRAAASGGQEALLDAKEEPAFDPYTGEPLNGPAREARRSSQNVETL